MTERSAISRLFAGSSIIFGGKVLKLGLSFIGNIIIARLLGATVLGTISLGVLLMTSMTTIALLGTNTGITRYLSRSDSPEYKRAVISQGLKFSLPLSLFIGGAVYFQSEWIALHVFNAPNTTSVLEIFGIAIPIFVLKDTFLSGIRGLGLSRSKVYVEDILIPILKTSLISGAVIFTVGKYGVAWAYLIASGAGALVLGYQIYNFIGFNLSTIAGPSKKEFLRYSTPLLVTSLMTKGFTQIDRLFISQYWQTDLVGIYSGIYNLMLLMMVVITSINFLFLPLFSRMHSNRNKKGMRTVYRVSTKWAVAFSLPIVITFVTYPTTVIQFTYGEEFVGGSLALIILAIGAVSHIVSGLNRSALKAIGDTRTVTIGTAAVFFLNITLNLLLVPRFSVEGAAFATTGSYILWNLYFVWVLKNKVRIKIHPPRNILFFMGTSFGLTGIAYSTKLVLNHNLISLLIFILLGGVFYLVSMLFFLITAEDIDLLRELNNSSSIELDPLINRLHNRKTKQSSSTNS